MTEHLQENPSLEAARVEVFAKAYWRARYAAGRETDMDPDVFPADPPFTLDQALMEDWLPEPAVKAGESAG